MIWFTDPHDHANGAGFPRTVSPKKTVDFASVDAQIQLIDGPIGSVAKRKIMRVQNGSGFRQSIARGVGFTIDICRRIFCRVVKRIVQHIPFSDAWKFYQ